MAAYRRRFAFIILNECHLLAIDFEREICFRYGIKIQSALPCVVQKSLPDQMIFFSPDGHLRSSAKDVIWHHFIFAHIGVQKLCVQFDRHMRFQRFRSRSWQFPTLEWDATPEDG